MAVEDFEGRGLQFPDAVSGLWYILGGTLIGMALGLLIAPYALTELRAREDETGTPGLASRLIKKIPRKVKVAGVVGAVKGAGGEAYDEVKEKVAEKTGRGAEGS
jgi:hypothetical protein